MLLERVGLAPDLLNPTDIDETPKRRETPRRLSIRLAEEKAKAAIHAPQVKALGPGVFILAAIRWWGSAAASCPRPKPARRPMTACGCFRAARTGSIPRSA